MEHFKLHQGRSGPGYSCFHLLGLALLLVSAACSPQDAAPQETGPAPADPAQRLANRVMEALGGKEAWEKTRHIRFTFFGRRTHHWDKWTGNHRMEGDTQEGNHYVVLHNIQTRSGRVYLDGQELQGEPASEWLDRGYSAWVNDTYWLLMPYKLRDPGVQLTYQGTQEVDGQPHEVLHLSFESVGLTPGDQYWAYINPETGLMERWAYLLQSMEPDADPVAWKWVGWHKYGRIMLAPKRIRVSDGREAELGDIGVFDELPETVYTSPEPVSESGG